MRRVVSARLSWPVWARVVSGADAAFLGITVIVGIAQGPQKTTDGSPSAPSASASPTATPEAELVPALVGMTKAEAASALSSAGLGLGGVATRVTADQPAGTLLSATPAADTSTPAGTVVRLVIAAAPPRVPSVVGMPVAQATSVLKRAGLWVSTATRTVSTGSDGGALSETSGGTSGMSGTGIQITVAHLYVPPPPPAASQPPAQHSGPLTNSGTCIRGGEFCRQADYGTTGYDADGRGADPLGVAVAGIGQSLYRGVRCPC